MRPTAWLTFPVARGHYDQHQTAVFDEVRAAELGARWSPPVAKRGGLGVGHPGC